MVVVFMRKKVYRTTEAQLSHSSNHHKNLPKKIIGGKTVKNRSKNNRDMAERALLHRP